MMITKSLIDYSYFARYVLLNAVDISDYKVFPERIIQNAAPTFSFSSSGINKTILPLLNQVIPSISQGSPTETIDQFLEHNGTIAFLVIKNDTLLFEQYYNGYDRSSICTSFSTVKSFVSAMIGIALHEKLIYGLDDSITKYLPEISSSYGSDIKI